MNSFEGHVYSGLLAKRICYTQLQWNRVQMFLAFNVVAIPIFFSTPTYNIRLSISLVAFAMHALILNGVGRAEEWIKYIDENLSKIEKIENQRTNDPNIQVNAFSSQEFKQKRNSLFASRKVFCVIAGSTFIFWLGHSIIMLMPIISSFASYF